MARQNLSLLATAHDWVTGLLAFGGWTHPFSLFTASLSLATSFQTQVRFLEVQPGCSLVCYIFRVVFLRFIFTKRTMYQLKVDVDILNAVKSVFADVSSVSPSSEQKQKAFWSLITMVTLHKKVKLLSWQYFRQINWHFQVNLIHSFLAGVAENLSIIAFFLTLRWWKSKKDKGWH